MKTLDSRTVEIGGREITIKKLPLRKLVNLLSVLKELPDDLRNQVMNLDNLADDSFVSSIPEIVSLAMPEFAKVVVRAVDDEQITEEVLLDEFGLDEDMELIYQLLEVNNIAGIADKIKKVQALYHKIRPASQSKPQTLPKNG